MNRWKFLAIAPAVIALWTAPATATWIALAASGDGAYGYSVRRYSADDKNEAVRQAVAQCGKANCRLEFVENIKCLAYAESREGGYWFGDGYAHTEGDAINIALHGCRLGAPLGTCRLIRSACNDD